MSETARVAPQVPTSPKPTSLPPPALTNPLPQVGSLASSASIQSSTTSPHTTTVHVAGPSAQITITNSVVPSVATAAPPTAVASADSSAPPAAAKEKVDRDLKVSNVPSVFIPPEYINRTADYQPEAETARPAADRVCLEGTTVVDVPHMYDLSAPSIPIPLSNDDLQFHLRPSYLPHPSAPSPPTASSVILYLNAQDTAFYRQLLPSPRYVLWILIKNTSFILNTANNVGYVKRRLVEEALRRRVQVLLMNPNDFDLAVSRTGVSSVVYKGKEVALPAAVIPRVGANVDYFGLAVLRQLEALGVTVFNPVNAIEVSRDKLYTHQVLSSHGLAIPRTLLSRMPFEYDYVEAHFGYPLIVKLASGSRGEAVWKVDSREELSALLERIDKSKPVIVQQFVQQTQGRDIRSLVVGDRVVASCMRLSSSSFKANYHQGGSTIPIELPQALQEMVVKASALCGLSFSGVDVLLGDVYRVCEVNSSPGFEGLERATAVNCAEAMLDWVDGQVERRAKAAADSSGEAPRWRVRETAYPLQEDHMAIIRDVQRREKEEQRKAEEEKKTATAAAAEAQPPVVEVGLA